MFSCDIGMANDILKVVILFLFIPVDHSYLLLMLINRIFVKINT